MLILRHEARARGFAGVAHPDLAVRMQAAAAGGGNGREPRAVQQPGVGDAAVRMQAAIGSHHLVPGRLARLQNGRIRKLRAIEFVLVEIGDDFVAVLDEGDRRTVIRILKR